MRKNMRISNIVILFFLIGIMGFVVWIDPINYQDSSNSVSSIDNSNILNNNSENAPQMAQTGDFDRVGIQDDLSVNPSVSGNWAQWSDAGAASNYFSYNSAGQYELLTSDTSSEYFSYRWQWAGSGTGNLFDSTGVFTDARISVEWSADLPTADLNDWVHWQYSLDGSTWFNFTDSASYTTADLAQTTSVWDVSECGLTSASTEFYFRMEAKLTRRNLGLGSLVYIYSVEVLTFDSSISDNSDSLGNLNQITDVIVSFNVNIGGTESDMSTNIADWHLYYSYTSSTVGTSNEASSTGSFTGDTGTITYTIPITAATDVWYQIVTTDNDLIGNSMTYETTVFHVQCFDGIDPTIGTITRNATNDNLNYTDDLQFTIDVSDVGGSHLDRIFMYWKNGDSGVSDSNYEGTTSYTWGTNLDTDTVNLIIPNSYFDAKETTYAIIYLYDKAGNIATSSAISITPNDFIAPSVKYLSNNTFDDEVNYDELLSIQYSVIEDSKGVGLNPDSSGFLVCYTVNRVPTAAWDYDGSVEQSHSGFINSPYTFIDIYARFSLGDVIYFWVNANDSNGNWNSTYSEPQVFTVVDHKGPNMAEMAGSNSFEDLNYLDDRTIQISVYEPSGGAGVNLSTIEAYYRINNATFDQNSVNVLLNYSVFNDVWYYNLTHDMFSYGDIVYFWFTSVDNFGNRAWLNTTITIIDLVDPTLSLITTYPDTNISYARTKYDLQLTVEANDDSRGSKLNRVQMAYVFDNNIDWDSAPWYINGQDIGNNKFRFIIPSNNLTASDLYYAIRAYDNDGNYVEITGHKSILEQKIPHMIAYSLGNDPDQYLNVKEFDFTFNVSENCLMFVYLNDTLLNSNPYQGIGLRYSFNLAEEGEYNLRVDYYNQTWSYIFYLDWTAPNAIPSGSLKASFADGKVSLTWAVPEGSENEKLTYFIYRGTSPDFNINDTSQALNIGTSEETMFIDNPPSAGQYYYKVYARDAAGNIGPVSESVSVVVTGPNWVTPALIVGGVAAAAIVGVKVKGSKTGKTLAEKGEAKKFLGKGDDSEDGDLWSDKEESSSESWKDLSHDAWANKYPGDTRQSTTTKSVSSASGSESAYASNSTSSSTTGGFMATSNSAGLSRSAMTMGGGGDPTARFDPEMKELYQNAQEFAEFGQESMAAQSYEMLLRLAEKKGDAAAVEFIRQKMDELYK